MATSARVPRLRMVEAVLRWSWDPIGLRGVAKAFDEYVGYAPALLAMLDRGATDREVADHLGALARDRMMLRPDAGRDAAVAALLRELRAVMA